MGRAFCLVAIIRQKTQLTHIHSPTPPRCVPRSGGMGGCVCLAKVSALCHRGSGCCFLDL